MKLRDACCLLAPLLLTLPAAAWADATRPGQGEETPASGITYKLTPSWYGLSDGSHANDLNLRGNTPDWTFWLGHYRQSDGYRQSRGGLERNVDLGSIRLVLSGQTASGGFLGGSISGEVGGATYAILGFGRTNLRDYYNLNFDPNDAVTLGVGHRDGDRSLALYQTFDDRLGTGQRVTHGIWRGPLGPLQRVTVDVSYKRGRGADDQTCAGTGLTLTADFPRFFLRAAHDPKVNFTAQDMTRIALGVRF